MEFGLFDVSLITMHFSQDTEVYIVFSHLSEFSDLLTTFSQKFPYHASYALSRGDKKEGL